MTPKTLTAGESFRLDTPDELKSNDMKFIADLHIHSSYSRATSKALTFDNLYRWGIIKGISLIGTGDCTHPQWLSEMREQLVPDGTGLLQLRKNPKRAAGDLVPKNFDEHAPVRFMITGEISNIYKWDGATRKVHNVVCLPDLDAAARFKTKLERIGNIASDGRPILGLDSRDLFEILLESSPEAMLIPAHIWTPWFSVLGSKSGFDSVEACYRDLAPHIAAVETGLSSDPAMNWRVSHLDKYVLISNSDAHSPGNLGREANLFDCELSYAAISRALRTRKGFLGTLEFFPEEGKYHYDGHRKCGICFSPPESKKHKGLCPVCGKELTLGVDYRVEQLADRPAGFRPPNALPYRSMLSLDTLVGEIMKCGSASKKVTAEYHRLITDLGPELPVLLDAPLKDIEKAGSSLLAEGIRRIREAKVSAQPGYDGEYGIIRAFKENELDTLRGQSVLFEYPENKAKRASRVSESPAIAALPSRDRENERAGAFKKKELSPNPEQREAITHDAGPIIVIAGPGTGKTRTLVERVSWLLTQKNAPAESILAVTFSNRAAREMAGRIEQVIIERKIPGNPEITTFHRLGLTIIAENPAECGFSVMPSLISEFDSRGILRKICAGSGEPPSIDMDELERELLASADMLCETPDLPRAFPRLTPAVAQYVAYKRERSLIDFTDLLLLPVWLLTNRSSLRAAYCDRWPHILVDEYQDVNILQYRLLRLLALQTTDLFAIGDPDQAIYGFRGSDLRYFSLFISDYPGSKTVSFSRSYRSTPAILRAGSSLLASRTLSNCYALTSTAEGPERIAIAALPTENAEAEHVVKSIEEMIGGSSHFAIDSGRGSHDAPGDIGFRDIAVLYRLHTAGEPVAQALERSGIPVQRVKRSSLLDTLHAQAALALVGLCGDPANVFRMEQLLGMKIPGISRKAEDRIAREILPGYDGSSPVIDWLRYHGDLSRPEQKAFDWIIDALGSIAAAAKSKDMHRAILAAARVLGAGEEQLNERPWALIGERAAASASIAELQASLTLDNDADFYDPRSEGIALMTLHAAKGLEWKVVFIVGCEEDIIPYVKNGAVNDLDEERRLLYVGITRAKHSLLLSHAATRMINGKKNQRTPSRFLDDIADEVIEHRQPLAGATPKRKRADGVQLGLFD